MGKGVNEGRRKVVWRKRESKKGKQSDLRKEEQKREAGLMEGEKESFEGVENGRETRGCKSQEAENETLG